VQALVVLVVVVLEEQRQFMAVQATLVETVLQILVVAVAAVAVMIREQMVVMGVLGL
jgi:hypothetical protein